MFFKGMELSLFFLFWLGLIPHAVAESSVLGECDIELLTKDCRIFDAYGPVITFPDGTQINNPRVPINNSGGVHASDLSQSPVQVPFGKMARLVQALDQNKKITEDFKMSLLQNINLLVFLEMDPTNKKILIRDLPTSKTQSFALPWPADQKNQKIQTVSVQQIADLLNSKTISDSIRVLLTDLIPLYSAKSEQFKRQYDQLQVLNQKNQIFLAQRKTRIRELTKMASDTFERVFEQNQKNAPKEVKILKDTLSVIKVKFEDEMPAERLDHCRNGPNAFYDPSTHVFVVCNSLLMTPDSQLIGIIGHELAHSVDPCLSTMGLSRVDPLILESFIEKPALNQNQSQASFLMALKSTGSLYTRLNSHFYLNPNFLRQAQKAQLMTPIHQGFSEQEYPFQAAKECILKGSSFRDIDPQDTSALVQASVETLSRSGSIIDINHSQIEDRITQHSSCLGGVNKYSEMGEVMSDMWGAVVMSEYLKAFPVTTDLEKLSLNSFFATGYCAMAREHRSGVKISPDMLSTVEIKDMAERDSKTKRDASLVKHPSDEKRLNLIYLSHPEIAKNLGCKPTRNRDCFESLVHFSKFLRSGRSKQVSPAAAP